MDDRCCHATTVGFFRSLLSHRLNPRFGGRVRVVARDSPDGVEKVGVRDGGGSAAARLAVRRSGVRVGWTGYEAAREDKEPNRCFPRRFRPIRTGAGRWARRLVRRPLASWTQTPPPPPERRRAGERPRVRVLGEAQCPCVCTVHDQPVAGELGPFETDRSSVHHGVGRGTSPAVRQRRVRGEADRATLAEAVVGGTRAGQQGNTGAFQEMLAAAGVDVDGLNLDGGHKRTHTRSHGQGPWALIETERGTASGGWPCPRRRH